MPRRATRRPSAPAALPDRIEPMLAQAAPEPFDSDEHLFEVKWDGTRCIAFVEADRIQLQNRRYIEMRERYPELAVLGKLPAGIVLDGEIIVLEGGKPSFNKLQQREHLRDPGRIELLSRRMPATLMAFDLLYLRGERIMAEPLRQRRERLAELVQRLKQPQVIVPDFVIGSGVSYFEAAEAHGLEGIMAKRLDSPYTPGKRSPNWLKIKVAQTAQFDIIGYTPHERDPHAIGALIIGEPHGRRWAYKGKVGTGFTEQERRQFFDLLQNAAPLERPPANGPADAVWRLPGYRCLVRFFEKTAVGMLRAPSYKGLVK